MSEPIKCKLYREVSTCSAEKNVIRAVEPGTKMSPKEWEPIEIVPHSEPAAGTPEPPLWMACDSPSAPAEPSGVKCPGCGAGQDPEEGDLSLRCGSILDEADLKSLCSQSDKCRADEARQQLARLRQFSKGEDEHIHILVAEADEMRTKIERYQAEIDRLNGIIAQHNLCHDLHGKVNAEDFAKGCAAEIKRIYGSCPWEQEIDRLRDESVAKLPSAGDWPVTVGAADLRAVHAAHSEGSGGPLLEKISGLQGLAKINEERIGQLEKELGRLRQERDEAVESIDSFLNRSDDESRDLMPTVTCAATTIHSLRLKLAELEQRPANGAAVIAAVTGNPGEVYLSLIDWLRQNTGASNNPPANLLRLKNLEAALAASVPQNEVPSTPTQGESK